MANGFAGVSAWARAYAEGRVVTGYFVKTPLLSGTASVPIDFSAFGSIPSAQYYLSTPLVSVRPNGINDRIYCGDSVSPKKKFLSSIQMISTSTSAVSKYSILDYLLYYPLIDCGVTSVQTMVNSVALNRYTDGGGVQVVALLLTQLKVGGGAIGSFTFDYINQSGVAKTSPVQAISTNTIDPYNTFSAGSTIANPAATQAYCELANGDTGVRSITSIAFTSDRASPSFAVMVLVKPLVDFALREGSTPVEVDYITGRWPMQQVFDGAHLGLFSHSSPSGSGTGNHVGSATFVWSD